MSREYDGYNDEAVVAPATLKQIITGANFDAEGAIFWLRYIVVRNSSAAVDGVFEVYDQVEGAAAAASKRFEFDVPANATTVFEVPSPGISFKIDITAGITGNLGTVAIGTVHAGGYLVGGM